MIINTGLVISDGTSFERMTVVYGGTITQGGVSTSGTLVIGGG